MSAALVLGFISIIWLASFIIAAPNLLYADIHTWNFDSGDSRTACYLNWPDGDNGVTDLVYDNTFISECCRSNVVVLKIIIIIIILIIIASL